MENKNNGLRMRAERIYFAAGDQVEIKHPLEYKPLMIVLSVDKIPIRGNSTATTSSLLGVTCFWFSSDMKFQSERFNTKDLSKL